MSSSFFLSWFFVMFPLVISPGPANIVFAASGLNNGIKKSLPLLVGVDLVMLIKSIIIGFGLGKIIEDNPILLNTLQLFGALYLFFLAFKFLRNTISSNIKEEKNLGFLEGVMIQIFNVKGWILITLMFSLFASSDILESNTMMILLLIGMLSILNITCHLIWIIFSTYIFKLFLKNRKVQNVLFSISLFIVGFMFILDNELFKRLEIF